MSVIYITYTNFGLVNMDVKLLLFTKSKGKGRVKKSPKIYGLKKPSKQYICTFHESHKDYECEACRKSFTTLVYVEKYTKGNLHLDIDVF